MMVGVVRETRLDFSICFDAVRLHLFYAVAFQSTFITYRSLLNFQQSGWSGGTPSGHSKLLNGGRVESLRPPMAVGWNPSGSNDDDDCVSPPPLPLSCLPPRYAAQAAYARTVRSYPASAEPCGVAAATSAAPQAVTNITPARGTAAAKALTLAQPEPYTFAHGIEATT